MNPKQEAKNEILVQIKDKSILLTQQIDVRIDNDGILVINPKKLIRSGSGGKQNNHIVPVATFLASIQYNLKRQNDISKVFDNLSYIYSLGDVDFDKFQAVKEHYDSKFAKITTRARAKSQDQADILENTLKNYVIPFIYSSWNEREYSTFQQKKSSSELGIEGNKVKALQKQFTELHDNTNKLQSFNDFKVVIKDFMKQFNGNIDIPNNITPQSLPAIIIDTRNYLNIVLNIIENSDKNDFLHDQCDDSTTLLKLEVEKWHQKLLKKDSFGQEFITDCFKSKTMRIKQPFFDEWSKYLSNNPDGLSGSDIERTLTESGDQTDVENSPIRNRDKKIEYNSNNIQQILVTSTGTKIEIILDVVTVARRQGHHVFGTDKLIGRIQQYITKQNKDAQHYLVIDCTSSSLVDLGYLAELRYSNKHQDWKLDIRPLVNYNKIDGQEKRYLTEKLSNIKIGIYDAPKYYNLGLTSARVDQVLEYTKLRIKDYPILNNDNFAQYQQKLDAITNAQPNSYANQHYQESKINTQSLLLSPLHLLSDADTEFIPPESIDVSKGSYDIVTRSRAHASQDLNNPQPGSSGVQPQGQKRTNLDVGSQPSLKKACTGKSGSRSKRATDTCLFSWEDLDEISTRRAENIDELQIDNKRFLEYLKDSGDQAKNSQLLELVKIRQIENSDNIVGNYKYLLDQVIQDGGYNNYRQNERIQDIAYNLAKNGFSGISTNLKNTIINAAGQIQLVSGTHGTIVACQTEGAERDCILSGLGLSYSFLSQPIEDILVKQGSKFVIKVSKNFAQTVPRILGYNTKFVLKMLSAKYGTVFLKGAAGGITGVFDIVDIALSAQALKECSDRADTDSKCSDREIRDNIASITFSGVSFVAGIVLTAASAGGPVTIGVALVLMAAYGIYSGVSAIVEYEEKYDTTDDENWRVFWHNFALQSPPEDVQHLAARTEAVNNIVKTAWKDLTSMPANVVAYAGGLGKIRLQHFPKDCRKILKYIQSVQGGGHVYVDECSPAYTKPYLESSSAIIDVTWSSSANSEGLSRILPNPINGVTMTCLPKATDEVYEKSGTSKSYPNAIHQCNNSFVMERNANQHNQSIVFNTQLINSGTIRLGSDGRGGIFLLNSHNVEIHTSSHRNEFIFLHNKFPGSIYILKNDSGTINIFSTEQLSDRIVTFHIEDNSKKMNIFINGERIKFYHYANYPIQIQYFARKNQQDQVTCASRGAEFNSNNIFINSGGGFNNQRQDIIKNCNKVIIWPYTKVEGNNGTYIFYIKTLGYEKQNSSSEINIIGKGTIIFLDTALLKDYEDITYSEASNTISLPINLGGNILYRLEIKNYLDKSSKVPNFNLIDKHGSNIVLKIEQGATIINKFELNIEKEVHASDTNDISVVKRYYRKISDKKINYDLFGSVKYKEKYYLFGSDAKDIITLDKHTQFVQGGEESDIYIVSNDMDMGTVNIDNGSRDKKLDIIMVQSIDDVSLVSRDDNLNILLTKTKDHLVKIDNIIVRNYFVANWYKNLLLVEQEGKAFIPFFNTNKDLTLVPFYSCNIGNRLTIQTDGKVVFDCDLNKIEYYRDNDNLILFDKIVDYPIITIEQFFNNSLKWQIYHYRNKEEVALLKNNILDYYIFEYFSSDIDIENLRIEFTQLLNDSVVLSEKPLSKKGNIIVNIQNKWKGDNFVYHVKSGSSNISAMVKFVSEIGDCNDKYLRFNQRDNDVILLHKCSNNKEAKSVQVEIKDYIASHPRFIFSKTKRMVIDDYHPITTDVQSGASRAKDYKEKIKALYNKIFKEYEIDFSKSFEITHNQQTLANGTLIPISSDQERVGIIIFKDIFPYQITVSMYNEDLIIRKMIGDHFRDNNIIIKNYFVDRKYIIPIVEFDLGLEPIRIDKWDENIDTIKAHNTLHIFQNKIRLADAINRSSDDELYTLKCVTIVNNLNSTVKSYAALGFSSPEAQINFVKNCKFTESSLVQLKTFIDKIKISLYHSHCSSLVLPPPNMVNNRLALDVWYELALRGYNYQKASEIYNNISGEFDFDKIIENINKVQNALSNKPDEEVFQRNRRDVNVDDKFITSGANSISSPINELFNWFKNKYHFIFNLVKVPHDSKATEGFLGGEQGPRFKYTDNPYNINDELANSNTYNVARSSASILELSFSFNNELWSEVWTKLSNLVNFNLLPGVEGTTTDKSKSFNDIYKLIKQSNNHPSDTQINKSNDITSQYNYEIPNSKYKNSVTPNSNDQKLHCVPYSWDSNNQEYVTDTMTYVSPSGQAKVFSNVHQETNFIQTKVYSIHGDIYTNCRPVEFYGRDSVYCEGKHTNMIYTPVFQSKFFDNLDVQIMLFRVGVHLVKKVLDCMKIKPKQEYIERHIEIDKETIDLWTKSIEKVEILLNDLQDLENLNQEDLKFINNTNDDLCEIRQNIKNYMEKKMITTKEYEIINEKLEVLIEELDETENRYFINVKEDCNQKISIEQLPHTSNGVQHNTVYNGYYIGHNNSQEYYNNSYLLHDTRPILTDLEVMNQNFGGNNMIPPSLIGNTTEIGSINIL